ncbi:hypothetical protein [Novosphingopyxis baekryungensis]|jgi:hypothetical protein|uniref:hypothetical protein n=1 Tax=Novosphingopyxis baekryungensis TaxID=279369 RepID=UPI0003B652C0|nr:hypothetical protein [Novosphingopyxis baekryungensis]
MTVQPAIQSFGVQGAMKRYSFLYHHGETNHCPGCGHTHWHIGRATAECANCFTAMPLAEVASTPARPLFYVRSSKTAMAA